MRHLSWVVRIIGIYIFLTQSVFLFLGSELTERAFENSQNIDSVFQFASDKVEHFSKENGRYPSRREFEEWNEELSKLGVYGKAVEYYYRQHPEEATKKFGVPPENGYVFAIWRGEWWEYYVSWVPESTLPKSLSEYYATGTRVGDSVLFMIVGFAIFSVSFYPRFKKQT